MYGDVLQPKSYQQIAFRNWLQSQHKRVSQFATAKPNGASNIFHVLDGIYTNIISTQVTQPNEQDPTIIVPLDLHNAFSMEGRQHILQHFASACPIVLNNENSKAWPSGTDGISYGNTSKPTTACQCMTGNLKFTTQKRLILFKVKQVHNHEIHLEQSFFRLLYNPSPIKLLIPILILAFVDNVCLMGPSSQVLPGVDAFATTNGPPWTQSIST